MGADDNIGVEDLLPKEDAATSNGAAGDLSKTEDSDEFWKPFVASSPFEKLIESNNAYVARRKSEMKNDGSGGEAEECKSEKTSKFEGKSSKSVRKNKWKEEEVKKLIGMHRELNDRFQPVKGRNVLWEEISKNLLAYGINKNPGQCKSMWTSLLQKYEVCFFF